jgi:hypothetical protein
MAVVREELAGKLERAEREAAKTAAESDATSGKMPAR